MPYYARDEAGNLVFMPGDPPDEPVTIEGDTSGTQSLYDMKLYGSSAEDEATRLATNAAVKETWDNLKYEPVSEGMFAGAISAQPTLNGEDYNIFAPFEEVTPPTSGPASTITETLFGDYIPPVTQPAPAEPQFAGAISGGTVDVNPYGNQAGIGTTPEEFAAAQQAAQIGAGVDLTGTMNGMTRPDEEPPQSFVEFSTSLGQSVLDSKLSGDFGNWSTNPDGTYNNPLDSLGLAEAEQIRERAEQDGIDLVVEQDGKTWYYNTGSQEVNNALYGEGVWSDAWSSAQPGEYITKEGDKREFQAIRDAIINLGLGFVGGPLTGTVLDNALGFATGEGPELGGGGFGVDTLLDVVDLGQAVLDDPSSPNAPVVVAEQGEFGEDQMSGADETVILPPLLGDLITDDDDEGGGGSTAEAEDEELSTGGPPGGGEELPSGGDDGEFERPQPDEYGFILPNHEPRDDEMWRHTNPDGSIVAGNEAGEIWEVEPAPEEENILDNGLIFNPDAVFGSGDSGIDPSTGEPYVGDAPGSDAELSSGQVVEGGGTDDTTTGGNEGGTDTGNGEDDGDGDDGDGGDGDGRGTGQSLAQRNLRDALDWRRLFADFYLNPYQKESTRGFLSMVPTSTGTNSQVRITDPLRTSGLKGMFDL